ncbi:MAG: mechanosensitive ion channel [Thermoplasmata archaeon]|nr:mechanosensitive ion channel [Thermoplasmata archaeon]
MNKRKLIAIAVILMTVTMMAPIASEGTEAISQNDYSIVIAGYYDSDHKQDVNIDLTNGQNVESSLYIYNKYDKDLDIQFTVRSYADEVQFTSVPGTTMVKAHDMTRLTFSIAVVPTCNSMKDVNLKMGITITELPDNVSVTEIINFNVNVISEYDSDGSYNKFFGFIENNLPEPFNTSITPFIASMIAYILLSYLACIIIVPRLANFFNRMTVHDDQKKFEKIFTSLVVLSIGIVTINPGLVILGADASILDLAFRLTMTFVIITASFAIWKIYIYIVQNLLYEYEKMDDSVLDTSLMPVFSTFGKLIICVFAAAWLMYLYGFNLQGIIVSAGLISLGITMGAQRVLSQFFSGISLLLTKRFRRGDHVKINGDDFIVKKVKLMYTEFTNKDMSEVITIPNDRVESAVIRNSDADPNAEEDEE